MEYLVTMTTHVPDGTSEAAVQDIRSREAARSRELAVEALKNASNGAPSAEEQAEIVAREKEEAGGQ